MSSRFGLEVSGNTMDGNMQLSSMSLVDKIFIGKRSNVCFDYYLKEGGTELRWCLGEVVDVSDGLNILKPGSHTSSYKKVKLL